MKGLVWKDIYTLLKQTKFILLVMVLFACLPGYSMSAFAIFYGAMLPITPAILLSREKSIVLAWALELNGRLMPISSSCL